MAKILWVVWQNNLKENPKIMVAPTKAKLEIKVLWLSFGSGGEWSESGKSLLWKGALPCRRYVLRSQNYLSCFLVRMPSCTRCSRTGRVRFTWRRQRALPRRTRSRASAARCLSASPTRNARGLDTGAASTAAPSPACPPCLHLRVSHEQDIQLWRCTHHWPQIPFREMNLAEQNKIAPVERKVLNVKRKMQKGKKQTGWLQTVRIHILWFSYIFSVVLLTFVKPRLPKDLAPAICVC